MFAKPQVSTVRVRQNRRNPRQGIETNRLPNDREPVELVRIDEIPVRGLKLAPAYRRSIARKKSE